MSKNVDEKTWNKAKKAFVDTYDKEPEKDFEWAIVNSIYQNMTESFQEDNTMSNSSAILGTKFLPEQQKELIYKIFRDKKKAKIVTEVDEDGETFTDVLFENHFSFTNRLVELQESEKFNKLRRAIRNQKIVTFLYKSGGVRVVEPYVLGTSFAGNKVIRGYQLAGDSSSGSGKVGWRLFLTKYMNNVDIAKEGFSGARPGLNLTGDAGLRSVEMHTYQTRSGQKKAKGLE